VVADEASNDPNPQQADPDATHAPNAAATQSETCSDPGSPGTDATLGADDLVMSAWCSVRIAESVSAKVATCSLYELCESCGARALLTLCRCRFADERQG